MDMKEAEQHVGYLLFEVSRLFRRRYEERSKSCGLTLQQARVIGHLSHHPDGLSQATLAQAIDSDPMTISGILDRLEKRALVKRVQDPADSRAKLVTITPEGRELFIHARSISRELFDQILGNLEDGHREILMESLKSIRNQLIDMSPENKESQK
ncbi:DNA-binding transcriptional regulator, MarR family [Cohaesibacter marisflavi]|uniref:DNA-binding transcriptional regulator, MarR family n=1 Tax=Cohaesibacter marisflavi TaxID=655353 RepID=A0A1I5CKE1_9HYPH|nr:MarR family transcriptional regulator [Cohaesibacter marisflavi]SFN87111.1 DNA-binding transcriptional regulator, MarR family [Cohaesibacter marisflavi]